MEEKERELLTEEALLERQRGLEQKEEELKKKESVLQKAEEKIAKTKHGIYDRIDVSVGTMDKIIFVLGTLLVIAIFVGIFLK